MDLLNDDQWRAWKHHYTIKQNIVYLNHGSFGPTPRVVQDSRTQWQRMLVENPMDFYLRQLEPALDEIARKLGRFLSTEPGDLVFVDNATVGMNIVAQSFPLETGDEVLLSDHEYGAVKRIWTNACEKAQARVVVQALPDPITDASELVASLLSGVTNRTRLIVVSHVTSPTATIFPVKEICQAAQKRGVPVCIDGPHALAMLPVSLAELGCDFYTASCHKWLSAPLGTGFLYVKNKWQQRMKSPITSWGASVGGFPSNWRDEFHWLGTRDPSPLLAIPAALEFLELAGWEQFRQRTHALAQYAREEFSNLFSMDPLLPDSASWYGPMVTCPIPDQRLCPPAQGQRDPLQEWLWTTHQIEIPIVWWKKRRHVRVSAHLYNTRDQIDLLIRSLHDYFAIPSP